MNRPSNMSVSALPLFAILLLPFLVIACVPVGPTPDPPIRVAVQPHQLSPFPCEDRFVPHPLDHITSIEGQVVRTYDSNGAGLAVNDLDSDGDLDLVLANLAGRNAIFWNDGNFAFRKQEFPHGQSRGVSIVDIDGDGWLDIAFAHRITRPLVWMNDGHSMALATRMYRPHKETSITLTDSLVSTGSPPRRRPILSPGQTSTATPISTSSSPPISPNTHESTHTTSPTAASSTMRTPEMTSSPPILPRNPRLSLSCSSISTRTTALTFG